MFRILPILTFLLLRLSSLHAQDKPILDSLLNIYNTSPHDSIRILSLNEIAKQYYRNNPDTAIALTTRVIEWSERIDFDRGKARALNIKGLGYWVKSNHTVALENFQSSLAYFERSHDMEGYGLTLNNMGLIYYYQNDPVLAREYFEKALKMHRDAANEEGIALALNNIGLTHEAQSNLNEAIQYYHQALRIYRVNHLNIGIGQSLTNIGYVYLNMGNYDNALKTLDSAVVIQETVKDKATLVSTLMAIAQTYEQRRDYDKSILYSKQALEMAREVKSTYDEKEAIHELYKIYKALEDYPRALSYYEQFKTLNDSIFSIKNNSTIASLEAKVELEAKQKEVELLEKQQRLQARFNYLVIVILLFVIVFVFFLWRNRRKLQHAYNTLEATNTQLVEVKREVELQAEMLQKSNADKDKIFSIVSHDLRAPLNSLKGLFGLLEQNSLTEDEMRVLIPDLGKRVRYASDIAEEILHWSRSQMEVLEVKPVVLDSDVFLSREMESFRELAKEKGVEVNLLHSVNCQFYADPDMIKTVLRNLVSNAIKFCRVNDRVEVSSHCIGGEAVIAVSDTGVGIKTEDLSRVFNEHGFTTHGTANEKGTGLGLMLCKELIQRNGGRIWVESEAGRGATFSFSLPLVKN